VNAPAVLLPYQQRWNSEKADVALWEKTRRCGASWCDAADSVLCAMAEGGMDALYIGYSEDMTREYIDDCAMWARAFKVACDSAQEFMFEEEDEHGDKNSIKAFRIDFASGHKILALSSRPRSIRGKQGKVTIDEAAFHDDLPGLMKAALALLIWGGKVRVISSHNGEANYFNEMVLAIRAERLPYALHRTTIDDALADGLYQRVCLKTGKTWSAEGEQKWRADLFARYRENADEELLCIPSQGTGIWLPRSLIEARMKPARVIRYTAPVGMALWAEQVIEAEISDFCERELEPELRKLDPGLRSVMGMDFGRHVDLSAIAPMQIEATLRKRIPFGVELAKTPYKAQEQIALYIANRLPRLSHQKYDAGGNGDYLAEQMQRRFGEAAVEKVKFSEQWYRENTAPFKADLEGDLLWLPKDDEVAGDFAAFRIVKGVPRVPDLRVSAADGGGKRHGDFGIAALLAHAAARADYAPIEFESLGSRPTRDNNDFTGAL
jgi:phage FluMu gp28-like protein